MLPRIFLPADQPVRKVRQHDLSSLRHHETTGCIPGEYETVCRELSFKPWAGANARIGARAQPPDIADVLLHETAIAGLRELIYKSIPVKPWEETAEGFAAYCYVYK